MTSETLSVPEEHLAEVIRVIRAGLRYLKAPGSPRPVSKEVREQLEKWCDEEEAYLKELSKP